MRIYLTSSLANKERCLWLRGWLEKQGHRVTSTWFDPSVGKEFPAALQPAVALLELDHCDAVLEYTAEDGPVSPTASFEAGYAYRSGKSLFHIGDKSSMFMERYGSAWPTKPPAAE